MSRVFIALAALLGGGIPALSKIALGDIPPFAFTLFRFLLAAAVLLPFAARSGIYRSLRDWKLIAVSLLGTANVTLFIFGVQRTTATAAQTLYVGVPLIAAVFSYFILKERITAKVAGGITLGGAGVLMIVLLPVISASGALAGNLRGNLIMVAAMTSFALYSVLSKQFLKNHSPLALTAAFVVVTTIAELLFLPFEAGARPGWWREVSVTSALALLYVGVIGTGAYYLLYQHAIKNATPVAASMILYLQPVSAYAWATVLLHERLTWEFGVGALLAFIGVALVTRTRTAPT